MFRFVTAAILACAIGAGSASAQIACGDRDSVVAKLGEKYGEVRRGAGVSGATAVFELFASPDTGTWTIMKTSPDGISCIMAVGNGWQDDTAPRIPGRDS